MHNIHQIFSETNVQLLYNERDKHIVPKYQRTPVWKLDREMMYLNSLIHGYAASPIIRCKHIENGKEWYNIVDGQHRIKTILKLLDNEVPVGIYEDKKGINKLTSALYWNKVPKKLPEKLKDVNCKIMSQKDKDHVMGTRIPLTIYNNITYEEEVQLYTRINQCVPATKADMIKARSNEYQLETFDKLVADYRSYTKQLSFSKRGIDRKFYYDLGYAMDKSIIKLGNTSEEYIMTLTNKQLDDLVERMRRILDMTAEYIDGRVIDSATGKHVFIAIISAFDKLRSDCTVDVEYILKDANFIAATEKDHNKLHKYVIRQISKTEEPIDASDIDSGSDSDTTYVTSDSDDYDDDYDDIRSRRRIPKKLPLTPKFRR